MFFNALLYHPCPPTRCPPQPLINLGSTAYLQNYAQCINTAKPNDIFVIKWAANMERGGPRTKARNRPSTLPPLLSPFLNNLSNFH